LDQATRILVAFATKGFEKATMSDLAEAAGVSRQTLYNRYGTKEGLLASAAEEFSRSARLRACAELNVGDRTTSECLLAAFSERIGILVPHMHGLPYGSQIVDLGTKLRRHSQADFPEFHADFTKELKFFLQSRGVCRTLTEAADTSFLLLMSAKGLLMNTRTREEFEIGMARIIAAVLHDRHRTSGQMF
jgi:AcrR family transcriptional regulator